MSKKTLSIFLIGLAIIAIAIFLIKYLDGRKETKPAAIENTAAAKDTTTYIIAGDTAPDFTVEMLSGGHITLSELKGKVVLLNFWATWCPPCNQELRALPEKIIKRFASNPDFVLLPISREEKRETVQEKMDQLKGEGIEFPVGIDPTREIYKKYALQTIPRNFLIGKDGKVVMYTIGFEEAEFNALADKIEELLK